MLGVINKTQYFLINKVDDAQGKLHIIINEKFEHRYDPEMLEDMDIFKNFSDKSLLILSFLPVEKHITLFTY